MTDFEETVDRFLTSLRAERDGKVRVAGYWAGRADEYAAQNAVERQRAYTTAKARLGRRVPAGSPR